MDYAAAADALMRRKILEDIYDRMTDEEKRLFIQMTMEQKSAGDIMQALQQQSQKIDRLQQTQQTFAQDFASNIAGNFLYGGVVWLARRLFK